MSVDTSLSSDWSSSSIAHTPTPLPYADTFLVDVDDGRVSAILSIVGCVFTVITSSIVLRSGIAFASVRRCSCNLILLYVAVIQILGSLNLAASASYIAIHDGKSLPKDSLWCQVNGGVAQVSFAAHSAMALFYVAIVLMYRKGNRSARRITIGALIFNTVLFIALSTAGALTGGGYVPQQKRMYCWINASHESYFRRFVLLYLWALSPIFFGIVFICYLLVKTWHMRAQTKKPWQMIRARISYSLLQLMYWGAFFFVKYFPDYDQDDSHRAILWGKRGSDFFQASIGGLQMLIFFGTEMMWQRWKIRKNGPDEDRIDEIEREILMYVHQGVIQLKSGGSHSQSQIVSGLGSSSHQSSTSALATRGSNNSSRSRHHHTRQLSTPQLTELNILVEDCLEFEKKDPLVQPQLCQILDAMGPGALPEVGGPSEETLLPGRSVETVLRRKGFLHQGVSVTGGGLSTAYMEIGAGGVPTRTSVSTAHGHSTGILTPRYKPRDPDPTDDSHDASDCDDASDALLTTGRTAASAFSHTPSVSHLNSTYGTATTPGSLASTQRPVTEQLSPLLGPAASNSRLTTSFGNLPSASSQSQLRLGSATNRSSSNNLGASVSSGRPTPKNQE